MTLTETELKEKFEESIKCLAGVKEQMDKHEGKFNTIDDVKKEMDALDFESVKKQAEKMGELLEEHQKGKEELENLKKETERLEKLLSRPKMSTEKNEKITEYQKQLRRYLYTGVEIDETLKHNAIKEYAAQGTQFWSDEKQEDNYREMKKNFSAQKGFPFFINVSKQGGEIKKSFFESSDPNGGYWVIPERTDMFIDRVFETTPVRTSSNVRTTASNEIEIDVDDEEIGTGGWVGETQVRPETTTNKIGMLTIPVHEQYSMPKATQNSIDDVGFNLEAYIQRKVFRRHERDENTAFVTGNGVKRPRGFLTYPASADPDVYERGKVGQLNLGDATDFTFDGIVQLQNLLKEEFQARAIFMIKRSSWADIVLLKDEEGRSLVDFDLFRRGPGRTLLGKPVAFGNDMPARGADALAIVYADFSESYTIVDKVGMTIIRDNLTDKPNILFYVSKRVGGDVTSYDALKIGKIAA